jgi:MFS family permease
VTRWWRLLREHAGFRRLWLAAVVSLLGDWLTFVSVTVLTLELGEGPMALTGVLVAHLLPAALLSPLAGTVADRHDRRRLMIVANVAQAVLTVGAAASAHAGLVLAVQGLVFARSGVAAFIAPAEQAAIRRVVPEDALVDANALLAATWSTAYVVGMAAGGFMALLGPSIAIALDALTFVIAALLAAGLPSMIPEREIPKTMSVRREIGEALAVARETPGLLPAVLAKVPVGLALGGGWLALQLVASEREPFGPTAVSIGVLQMTRGLGTGVGPMVGARAVRTGGDVRKIVPLAAVLTIASIVLFVSTELRPVLLLAALGWGMGSGANWVLSSTLIQRLSGDARIGRLSSIDELGNVGAMLVGATLSALLISLAEVPRSIACIVPPLLAIPITLAVGSALGRAQLRTDHAA